LHDSQSDIIRVPLLAYPPFAFRVILGHWQNDAIVEKNIGGQ
jgi:hypothetical protein